MKKERKGGRSYYVLVPPLRRGKKKEKVATSHLKAAWYFSGGLRIKEGSEFPFYILSSPSPFSHKQLPKEKKHACVKLSPLSTRFFSAAPPPTGTRRKTFHIRFFFYSAPERRVYSLQQNCFARPKKGKSLVQLFYWGSGGLNHCLHFKKVKFKRFLSGKRGGRRRRKEIETTSLLRK